MPATLSSIRGKKTEIRIYLGDPETPESERDPSDFFTLWYRQHNLTAKIERLAADAEKDGRALEALCEMCVPIFVRWDLKPGATDEQVARLEAAQAAGDGDRVREIEQEIRETTEEQSPIPITKEDLVEYVPSSVLTLILQQISESRRPNQNGTGGR